MSVLPEQPEAHPEPTETDRTSVPRLWLELCVVFVLAVLPHIINALYYLWGPTQTRVSSIWDVVLDVVQALQVIVPLLYIMRLSGKPWSYFGLTRPCFWPDVPWAALIFVALLISTFCFALLFPSGRVKTSDAMPATPNDDNFFLILVATFSVVFSEELAMRGYFIPRLEELLKSRWKSVLVSAAMFASYHVYYGLRGATKTFVLALVLGGAFCLIRRLWPLVLSHTLYNVIAHFIQLQH